jgi:SAM-dependent methyltransferase
VTGHYPAYAALAGRTWRDLRARLDGYPGGRHARILEVGCGTLYPYIALFHSEGRRVVGIDVLPLVRRDLSPGKYFRALGERGPVAAARRLASDVRFDRSFYRPLGRAAGVPVRRAGAPLVRMDATRCGFAAATFDVVYSTACFEHLPDVAATLSEIDRVLKPEGMAEIEVHLFASMTGGHEPELYDQRPPPAGFRVWSHLLDPGWRPPLHLNRWRDAQFHEAFAARFDILDRIVTSRHGEQYLTAEIASRLASRYTREELATESALYVLRKRA